MSDLIASLTNLPTIPSSLMDRPSWFLTGLLIGLIVGLVWGFRWRRY